jgi:glyoxylase-like metal-dependent hydrolase (beta-lactamase superfamily II)
MGGAGRIEKIQVVVLKGGGNRTLFGQSRKAGESEPVAKLTNLVEVYDYAKGRAGYEYDWSSADFTQHRREVFTKPDDDAKARPVGYMATTGRPAAATSAYSIFGFGPHSSPEIGMGRTYTRIALDIYETVIEGETTQDREFNGKTSKFGTAKTRSGEPLNLYFDPETKLLMGYEVTETDPFMGEIHTTYAFEDFKTVDGVPYPHRVKMQREGKDFADIQYTSVTFGDRSSEEMLALPASVSQNAVKAAGGEYVPLELVRVAPGVFHAQAFSHHSLIVEFPRWLVVVEAPATEIQTKYLDQLLRKEFPRKSVRYVAVTHPHHDHIGGVRGFAALQATVLVEKNHEADMKKIIEARHARPRDELERRRSSRPPSPVGGIEVYERRKVISEGGRVLELHAISTPHVEPMVVAYLPRERILFQSDLYTAGQPSISPAAKSLFDGLSKHNIRPDRIVGGHGGVGPFADLAKIARGS